jgi:hypothetical protein
VASDEIQVVGGELAAFLVLANMLACGPAIDAACDADLVWNCASSDLRTAFGLRYDGVIIACPMMGWRFPPAG